MLADSKVGEGKAFLELGMPGEALKCCMEAEKLKEEYGMDFEAMDGFLELKSMLEESGYGQGS